MLTIAKDDMVIVEVGETKSRKLRRLCRVEEVGTREVRLTFLRDSRPEHETHDRSMIIANLGPNPSPGWVYGISIATIDKVQVTGDDRAIAWRVPYDKELATMLDEALKKFKPIFDLVPFNVHVLPPKGKMLGHWAHSRQKSRASVMGLYLSAFKDQAELERTMTHEIGHGIWENLIPDDLRALMIKHYAESALIARTNVAKIRAVAEKFDAYDGRNWWTFARTLGDERRTFMKMLAWIKEVHHITKDDLTRLRVGGLKTVDYFPSQDIVTGNMRPIITHYGTKNAMEFFCEAYSHYHVGERLPRDVRASLQALEKFLETRMKEDGDA